MLGAIIGDIVGSRFEFDSANDYDFELFTNNGGDTCSFADYIRNWRTAAQ